MIELAELDRAFREGRVSWSKTRTMVRVEKRTRSNEDPLRNVPKIVDRSWWAKHEHLITWNKRRKCFELKQGAM